MRAAILLLRIGAALFSMKNPFKKGLGTYFQFPLCALAYGGTIKQRLDTIIDYATVEAGGELWRKTDQITRDRYLRGWDSAGVLPSDTDLDWERHIAALTGAEIIGVRLNRLPSVLERHSLLSDFINNFERGHDRDPLVRIRTDLLFEARDGGGMDYRELSIFAAIVSVVGDKQGPVLITQEVIRRRALGYKTEHVQNIEARVRPDGARPLTEWKLRATVDRLTRRKLIARATYGRRHTYYSTRMTPKALRRAVDERKMYAACSRWQSRLDDEEMTQAIRNQRAMVEDKAPPHRDLILASPFPEDPAFLPDF